MLQSSTVSGAFTLVVLGVVLLATLWVLVRALSIPLFSSDKGAASNYAGRTVHYGLGVVWFLWALLLAVGAVATAFLTGEDVLAVVPIAALAVIVFALGLFDDAYGSGESRGFRGHIRSARRGELTTGGLKLVGISLAALTYAVIDLWGPRYATLGTATGEWLNAVGASWAIEVAPLLGAVVAGAAIALTANLLNLTDLRPGRALKSYLGLVGVGTVIALGSFAAIRLSTGACPPDSARISLIAALVVLLAPAVVSWRYDLAERAMLGDAGANVMGAVAGAFIVYQLNLGSLVLYALVVFGLNLASEKVSFSRVIASNRALSYLDNLGRLKDVSDHPEE